MVRLAVVLFIIFGWQLSYAQSVWTLQKCIEYALENNLTVKQGKLAVKTSENNLLLSKAALPSASVMHPMV